MGLGTEVDPITIRIEFFGIPRMRAGVASVNLQLSSPALLRDVWAALTDRLPEFASRCLVDGELSDHFVVNVGGKRFVRDGSAEVNDGMCLLVLSADAGGS